MSPWTLTVGKGICAEHTMQSFGSAAFGVLHQTLPLQIAPVEQLVVHWPDTDANTWHEMDGPSALLKYK